MEVARFSKWACVKCGYVMDSASAADFSGALPEEGDLACCLRCAEPYLLESHRWRPLTDEELMAMSLDDKKQISTVQTLIRQFNKEHPQ